MPNHENEPSPELLSSLDRFGTIASKEWGETEYWYLAIPVRWSGRGRNAGHVRPITGLEKYEVTKAVYDEKKPESTRARSDAFMGKMKCSYTDYQRRVKVKGWREKLIEHLGGRP